MMDYLYYFVFISLFGRIAYGKYKKYSPINANWPKANTRKLLEKTERNEKKRNDIIQLLTGDEGNIWYLGPEDILAEGPTYHMLPESPVNNCFVIPSLG